MPDSARTTGFACDRNNRLTRETRPMGQAVDYTCDAAGSLLFKTDAKGQKIDYEYDPAGRHVTIRCCRR